jgi:hypothetical protein
MKTVICHFYNEEYLLPFWLNHHKRMFDKGIMINYHSTDRSVDIIKEICPDWDILETRNECFDAHKVDSEVELIEKTITGWRVVLNVTEFLIGDLDKNCNDSDLSCRFIPSALMICPEEKEGIYPDSDKLLCEQFTYGVYADNEIAINERRMRRMSSYSYPYNLGRHYTDAQNSDLVILWYRNSPYNAEMIKRNLQIQQRIPQSDKVMGFGIQHITNKEGLKRDLERLRPHSSDIFEKYKHLIASPRS